MFIISIWPKCLPTIMAKEKKTWEKKKSEKIFFRVFFSCISFSIILFVVGFVLFELFDVWFFFDYFFFKTKKRFLVYFIFFSFLKDNDQFDSRIIEIWRDLLIQSTITTPKNPDSIVFKHFLSLILTFFLLTSPFFL